MKRKFEDNSVELSSNNSKKTKLLETLEDLISYIENYNIGPNKNKLNKILPSLIKLQKLTGMTSVKNTIVGHILYFLMNFEKNKDMIHTVIEGPPGVGKTTLGYIIGEIYTNLDIIEQPKNMKKPTQLKFRIVKRSDLIAKYLGQTSHKTQEVINSVLGGVLFIDEAYSLGNNDGDDSYSKECLDTLNQNLSENKNQFLCIIAGYKDALERNFFAFNEGLRRRFPFTYAIEEYTASELQHIFLGMLEDSNWGLEGYKEKEKNKDKEKIELNKQKIDLNIIDSVPTSQNNKVIKLKKDDSTVLTPDKKINNRIIKLKKDDSTVLTPDKKINNRIIKFKKDSVYVAPNNNNKDSVYVAPNNNKDSIYVAPNNKDNVCVTPNKDSVYVAPNNKDNVCVTPNNKDNVCVTPNKDSVYVAPNNKDNVCVTPNNKDSVCVTPNNNKDSVYVTPNIITTIKKDQLLLFFESNKEYFPNFGGDIEVLFFQSKIEHCKRVFFKNKEEHKILTLEDINNGLIVLKKNKKLNKMDTNKQLSMYL